MGSKDRDTTPATTSTTLKTPKTGLRSRGNDTGTSTGRSGRQNAATRRNMRREERVTVQGPETTTRRNVTQGDEATKEFVYRKSASISGPFRSFRCPLRTILLIEWPWGKARIAPPPPPRPPKYQPARLEHSGGSTPDLWRPKYRPPHTFGLYAPPPPPKVSRSNPLPPIPHRTPLQYPPGVPRAPTPFPVSGPPPDALFVDGLCLRRHSSALGHPLGRERYCGGAAAEGRESQRQEQLWCNAVALGSQGWKRGAREGVWVCGCGWV